MKPKVEFELIKEINKEKQNENLLVSPIGIELILSLLSNGAEEETQKEILNFLNYTNVEEANKVSNDIIELFRKNTDIIKIANSILIKEEPKYKFRITAEKEYEAKIEKLKNYKQVNKWAENKTNKKITNIIDELPPNIIMVLLNALYFESFWTKKFDKNHSYEREFYNLDPKQGNIRTLMMFFSGELLNYYENDDLKAVKLDYQSKDESTHAIIILPKMDINMFIKNFNNENYEEIIKGLDNQQTKVNLFLPRFEMEFKIELSQILKNLGIKKGFTIDAEFKKLCDKSPIHIMNVIQKNYINVNEEGTQAASVNELEVILECFREKDPDAKDFIADRPFIFIIRNDNLPKGRDIIFFTKFCLVKREND